MPNVQNLKNPCPKCGCELELIGPAERMDDGMEVHTGKCSACGFMYQVWRSLVRGRESEMISENRRRPPVSHK
jgi:hypothetical protein